MVTIIIEKRHLFVFCIAVGLIIGGIFVYAYKANPDWTNSDPAKFGHSVDEMDWSKTINRDVSIGGVLSVGGQGVAFSDSSNVWLGDLYSADGPRNLIMRAGGADRIIITDGSGLVGIGKNPTEKLDVDGNIKTINLEVSNGIINFGSGLYFRRVIGTNPDCGTGILLIKKWAPRTCSDGYYCPGTSCTTLGGWREKIDIVEDREMLCLYPTNYNCRDTLCVPNSWTEVLCIGE